MGKSSLVGALLGSAVARRSKKPGCTQTVNFYAVAKAGTLTDPNLYLVVRRAVVFSLLSVFHWNVHPRLSHSRKDWKHIARRRRRLSKKGPGVRECGEFFLMMMMTTRDCGVSQDLPGYGYAKRGKGTQETWSRATLDYLSARNRVKLHGARSTPKSRENARERRGILIFVF